MNHANRFCFISFAVSLIVGLAGFLFSLFNLFSLENTVLFLILASVSAFIFAYATVFSLISCEKNRLLREAACSCGSIITTGFGGLIISALMTLLFYLGSVVLLFNLGIGFVFFFLTLLLSGISCFFVVLFQCHHSDC